ncbi:MAG TPA: VTT domain-containing protein [Vicinamibacterales bacterium]|jgi:membrane protein YqaA with SNARE-associated domain|nr:VTT domain-containing protein [Vicinamibacterales bacterium]
MKRVVAWFTAFAAAWGGPGLFLIGYLDSSFLSFPEVNDLLIIAMVTRHKDLLPYYAFMATLGSVLGCLTLYFIARKGGEAFLRKRFKEHHVEGGLKLFQKYGLLVVIVPALLPPPAPFKIFVLLAGVVAIPVWQFTAAVFIARGVRYGGEGLLAVYYGERASIFLQQHAKEIGLWLSGGALLLGAAWIAWKRRRRV